MTRTWTHAGLLASVASFFPRLGRAGILAPLATGCASPLHLQYDYGRAYTAAIISQADLTRPSVANSQYPLYGTEAEAIRIRVREKTTDEESNEVTLDVSR